ncbi:MAG: helix-turn-helix domain-containing protein [Phycisphaerales bacterium]|nr:helix-turn-helix domain-containing protein [Phycisphaerales bacterium]
MANVLATLNDHVRRLARRELRSQSKAARRATAQFRRDTVAMKRLVKDLQARLADVEKRVAKCCASRPVANVVAAEPALETARFRAGGLRTHRAKLDLSARDYGKLVGVSPLTIYHWEAGRSKPRPKLMANLAAVRSMGKREALQRLEEID